MQNIESLAQHKEWRKSLFYSLLFVKVTFRINFENYKSKFEIQLISAKDKCFIILITFINKMPWHLLKQRQENNDFHQLP